MMPGALLRSRHRPWFLLVVLLVAVRLPSLAQPAGGDQMLYVYAGDRILHGDVPYTDVWDQKPPMIHLIYGVLWQLWSDQSVVALADLVAAVLLAAVLIAFGRRAWSVHAGCAAASLFLLLGDPYLQRLSGAWVRGQTETFIALAVAAAIYRAATVRSRRDLVVAGLLLGIACWLKYNAIIYALPVAAAVYWRDGDGMARVRRGLADLTLVALGVTAVSAAFLSVLAVSGALADWWLATIVYNLTYSGETYPGPLAVPRYLLTMPVRMASLEMLWYLGGAGCLGLLLQSGRDRWARIVLAWTVAGLGSIALNGARDLPQYFVQMNPALAMAAAAGLAPLVRGRRPIRVACLALFVAVGLWRAGADRGPAGFKLAGIPGALTNVQHDVQYALGWISHSAYLARFERPGAKYVPASAEALSEYVRATTPGDESILVFGFTASVYLDANRRAASRFFWSRPVVTGFEADRPTYGAAGLLADLRRDPPSLIALQRRWGAGEPDPLDYFRGEPRLNAWLEAEYVVDRELPEYQVWRRTRGRN